MFTGWKPVALTSVLYPRGLVSQARIELATVQCLGFTDRCSTYQQLPLTHSFWIGREDSNLQPSHSKCGALPIKLIPSNPLGVKYWCSPSGSNRYIWDFNPAHEPSLPELHMFSLYMRTHVVSIYLVHHRGIEPLFPE